MKFRKLLSMLLIVAILGLTAVAEDSLVIQAELDGEAIPAESETLLSEAEDRMPAEEPLLIEDEAPEQGEPSQAEPQANASSLSDFQIENGVLKKYVGSGGDVVIPGSVTSIGESAFSCCDSVTSVVVPDSVTFIGEYAFVSCRNMTSITLPKGLSSLEWNLFGGCSKLKSVNIPNGITRIEGAVFSHCTSLPSITIPESVNSIGEDAFSGCESLKKITIPSGVTSIENGTFRQCKNLKTVNLPEGITNIGDTAFWDCASLTSLAIPSTVTTMGSSMFWNCTSLVSITARRANLANLGREAWATLRFGSPAVPIHVTPWVRLFAANAMPPTLAENLPVEPIVAVTMRDPETKPAAVLDPT